jgi:ArsR family transcriptional regulator
MSLPLLAPRRDAALGYCTPLAREPISAVQAENVAPMLKALADPVRLRLMSMILSHEGGEACAMCDLTEGFDLSQSTLSHHLKVLHDAGLVDRDKRGVWVYYRARPEAMGVLRTLFDGADDESVAPSHT